MESVRREGEFNEMECRAAWLSVLDSLESMLTRKEDFVTMLQQAGRNPSQKTITKYWTQHKRMSTVVYKLDMQQGSLLAFYVEWSVL
jgi:hypothetical protein